MAQRGYAQFVDIAATPALAWSACTEEHWLKRWYALEASIEPRRGGEFRVRTKDGRRRDATIDVWDPGRRLRLIYFPEPDMLHLHGEGEIAERKRKIFHMRILKATEDIIRERLLKQNRQALETLIDRTIAREIDPNTAAEQLLGLSPPGR